MDTVKGKIGELHNFITDRSLWRRLVHKHWLHFASLMLGAGVTFVFLIVAYVFYHAPEALRDNWFLRRFDEFHVKTIDLKQQFRGPIAVRPDLALVAIDNESVSRVGRWPWSRDKIQTVVEELLKYGAKVVAMDIMFSENSNHDVLTWFEQAKKDSSTLNPKFKKFVEKSYKHFDMDSEFASFIKSKSNNIITAATYDYRRSTLFPYQENCYNFAFEMSTAYKIFEEQGFDFISADATYSNAQDLPIAVEEYLKKILQERLDNKKNQMLGSGFSNMESQLAALEDLNEYCGSWLVEEKDPFYKQFVELWENQTGSNKLESYKGAFLWPAIFPSGTWLHSTEMLAKSTRFTGFINIHPDLDGTIRRSQLVVRAGPFLLPSMALRAVMLNLGADGGQINQVQNPISPENKKTETIQFTKEGDSIFEVQPDEGGRLVINFSGRQFSYPHVTIHHMLDQQRKTIKVRQRVWDSERGRWVLDRDGRLYEKSEFLRGKTVIIGATAIGLYDLRVTPFDENMPGPEIHLNIMENLLNKSYFNKIPTEPLYMYVILILAGFVITGMTVFFPTYLSIFVLPVSVLSFLSIDYLWFFKSGTIVAVWLPVSLATINYLSVAVFDHFTADKTKKDLRKKFESYVSPAIVEEVLADPEKIKLGGSKVFMSVFFSDIRGFTTISEALTPERLSDLLNLYLTPMTDLVFLNNGTLDKYMGDAVMAFFGAPIKYDTHADAACRCALMSIAKLKELNAQLKEQEFPLLDIGIGINTGYMSVGNMGSQTVRNYTVMGDAVNLGSRLEGINKQYGTRIIISEYTVEQLKGDFKFREIDWVRVKGKKEPVRIFELVAEGEIPEDKVWLLETFTKAYNLYHLRQWEEAKKMFQNCLNIDADDKASALYISRCEKFIKDPPGDDWDGVFVMTTK